MANRHLSQAGQLPSNALSRLAPLLMTLLVRPFGGTMDMADRHPWEVMAQFMQGVKMIEFYLGFVYVATGERGKAGCG
jgi:hypothetical protein